MTFRKQILAKTKKDTYRRPGKGGVLLALGWIFDQRALESKFRKRLQQRAKFYFRQALRYKRDEREAMRGLATVSMHEGQYSRALALYQKAHNMRKDADTYNDFGNLYRKLGQIEKSRQCYQRARLLARKTHNGFLLSIVQKNLKMLNERESRLPRRRQVHSDFD